MGKKVYNVFLGKDEAQQFINLVKEAEQEDKERYLFNTSECDDGVIVHIQCVPADLQYFNAMISECF